MRRREIFLLVFILLLGIGLRSVEVLNKNFLFGFDQGRDYLAVREIVVEKKPTLIGPEVGAGMAGLGGIFHGPYYFYSLILPFVLFRGDPYGGLVLMFLFGVASLFLCFYLIKKIFGTKAALVGTFLLAICQAISSQSRFIWNSHPTTFFILLAFWFTYKILEKPVRYFFLATFFAGLIYGFELAISVPLIISQFVWVFLVLKSRKIKTFLSGFAGVISAYLPFFAFEVRHGFMASKSILKIFSNLAKGEGEFPFLNLIKMHLSSFWLNFKHTFLIASKSLSFILLVLIAFSLYWILKETKSTKRKQFLFFLALLPLVSLGVFLFLNNIVWDYYLIHLHLVYIFLFALCLTKTKFRSVKMGLILFLVMMIPGVFGEIKRGHSDFYDFGGTAKIKGKLEALDYIYQDAQGEEFNVLVFTPPVHDYAYRYLLEWYGKKKYNYVPGDKKEGLFYLWIEPESSGLWHKGWLETVIKTGEILKEEELSNGFLIQKRYEED